MISYRRPASIEEVRGHLDKPCGRVTGAAANPVPAILLDVCGSLARGSACVRAAGSRIERWPLRSVRLGEIVIPSPDPLEPRARILHVLLRHFLADFLNLVDADSAADLLTESAVFCDPDVPGWTDEDHAAAGAVAHVPTGKGDRVTVFVQVEPQAPDHFQHLARRVFDLEVRHGQPVLASTIHLQGGKAGANLEAIPVRSFSRMVNQRMLFISLGLSDASAQYHLEKPQPLAWALAAAMRSRYLDRDELRKACLERIDSSSLAPEQKLLLRSFVEAGNPPVKA